MGLSFSRRLDIGSVHEELRFSSPRGRVGLTEVMDDSGTSTNSVDRCCDGDSVRDNGRNGDVGLGNPVRDDGRAFGNDSA